jgi:hypothetical protein
MRRRQPPDTTQTDCRSGGAGTPPASPTGMNSIIYIVGLVVVVLVILSFLGLR